MSRTPRSVTRAVSLGLVLALGISLTACAADRESSAEPAASGTTSMSASPSASPPPTAPSSEEDATSKAEAAVVAYYEMKDASLQAPANFKIEDYKKVAVSSALNDVQNLYNAAVLQGHQIGGTTLDSVEVLDVDLAFEPDKTPPEIPTVQFSVCYDITDLNIVDQDGKSIVPPGRQNRGVAEVGVSNFEYPEGPWLVGFVEYQEDKTC